MANCSYCGSTIIFGGKGDGDMTFCNESCLAKGIDVRLARRLPDDVVRERVAIIHQGSCPRCHGRGPVDVHVSYRVWSALLFTFSSSRPQVSCQSCGVKSKVCDAFFCLLFGWWGVPGGLIRTPIQLLRNVGSLLSPPDPSRASDALASTVRVSLARELIGEHEASAGASRESPARDLADSMGPSGESPIVRVGLGLVAFIFILAAPVSGYFLTKIFLEASATAHWPSAMGVLTKAQVAETGVGHYRADVAYSYRVGANDLAGSRVRVSDGEYNIRDGAVQAIDGLTVGQPVSVFYNPSNPQQSVLRPGVGFQEWALLFVPVLMLGIGVGCLCLLWRSRRRGRPPYFTPSKTASDFS